MKLRGNYFQLISRDRFRGRSPILNPTELPSKQSANFTTFASQKTERDMNTLSRMAVFCGSSAGNTPKIIEDAQKVGCFLADHHIDLVYGAGKVGLMGELAEAALKHNGKVIGVIPDFLKRKEIVHAGLDELYTAETMHERKLKMY